MSAAAMLLHSLPISPPVDIPYVMAFSRPQDRVKLSAFAAVANDAPLCYAGMDVGKVK